MLPSHTALLSLQAFYMLRTILSALEEINMPEIETLLSETFYDRKD